MLEREIEKKLVDGVRKLGGRAYKFVSPGNDGQDRGTSGNITSVCRTENGNRKIIQSAERTDQEA